jgi:hypothetical protein
VIVILLAIWDFLVALGPFLTALAGVITSVATALWEIVKIGALVTVIGAAIEIIFDYPRGAQRVGNALGNLVHGALTISQPLITALSPSLQGIVKAFVSEFQTTGPGLADSVAEPVGSFAAANFNSTVAAMSGVTESTADNAIDQAAAAIKDAFGKGLSATAVAASFEAMFPERLNTLNGIAPLLGEMAGFADVSSAIREPLYRAAFGRSAEYKFAAQFEPNLPDVGHATEWLARRIIGQAEFDGLFEPTGIKGEYQVNYEAAAYRPISPRLLTNLLIDQPFDATKVQAMLEDAGISPANIGVLLPAYEFNSVKALRQAYVASLEKSFELGSITEDELRADLASVGYSATAQNLVILRVAQQRLDALLSLYRRETSVLYKTNQLTDANYLATLEAGGLDPTLAEGYFGLDSAAVHGKELAAAARAAAKLEGQQIKLALATTKSAFLAGSIDAIAMGLAVTASGLDLNLVPLTIALFVAEASARRQDVYGLLLPRNKAILVREQVASIKEQFVRKLVDAAYVTAQLTNLNIPASNQEALLSAWTAQIKGPVIPV